MLSAPQVKELIRRGIDVGAHTVSHPILTRVDDVTARREILASKATLEASDRRAGRAVRVPERAAAAGLSAQTRRHGAGGGFLRCSVLRLGCMPRGFGPISAAADEAVGDFERGLRRETALYAASEAGGDCVGRAP